jgi:hypothetical protein
MVYRILRFVVLATSAVTPALALLRAEPLLTASVGAVAFLAEGAIQLTRLHDRALLNSRRATVLSRESRRYRTQVDDYEATGAFTLLVKRIEEIREQNDNERLSVVQQSFGTHAGQSERRTRA